MISTDLFYGTTDHPTEDKLLAVDAGSSVIITQSRSIGSRDTVSGSVYLAMLALFAVMPRLRLSRLESTDSIAGVAHRARAVELTTRRH